MNFSNEILNNLRVPNWVDYIADTLLQRVSLSLLVSFVVFKKLVENICAVMEICRLVKLGKKKITSGFIFSYSNNAL